MTTAELVTHALRLQARTPWWSFFARRSRNADVKFWRRQHQFERSDTYCRSVANRYIAYEMPCLACTKPLVLARTGIDWWTAQPHRCAPRAWKRRIGKAA